MMMESNERKQTMVLIRHGVALHNVIDSRTGQACNYRDSYFFDPPLVEDRMDDIVGMGSKVQQWFTTQSEPNRTIELIITSPLTRCIQTTMIAFGSIVDDDKIATTGTCPTNDRKNSHTCRPTIPILCREVIREAYGIHFPDQRRAKSVLMVCFVRVRKK
jgi:hypothetical protein